MKNYRKIFSFFTAVFLLAASPVFSQEPPDIENLKNAVNSFTNEMARAMPFNSTIGLNWSDAYIGQFLSVPPHFGIGLTVGATTMKMSAINGLLELFDADIPGSFSMGFPLPAYTVDARIGGFILPFDIGIKFGYLGSIDLYDSEIDYMLVGGDIRYALIDSKILPFKLSVGLGFNHLRGGISTTVGSGQSFSFEDPVTNESYTLSISDPKVGLEWQTNTFELKTQVSFPLFIITPYAGIGVSYAMSKAGYNINTKVNVTDEEGEDVKINDVVDLIKNLGGVTGVSENGIESITDVNDWNFRFYGGISLNIVVIKLDLTAMYNFTGGNFGATLGVRFQL